VLPASCCSRAKVTSRMEFAEATPTAMMAPIREGTLKLVPVMNSIVTIPHSVAGSRQDHDEWIAEILVVHEHEQIDQHGGEQQSEREIPEGIMHALDLAANLDRIARLELFFQLRDDFADLFGDAAEIAALYAGVDVVSRLNVRLI